MKRKDYINWDTYFMGLALLSSERSKDPNTQVGACIVNENKRIVSIGYNGTTNGMSDDECPWSVRDGNLIDTKYAYVTHAELNAILNCHNSVSDCILYVTLFPCNECAKAIIQSGIKEVVYMEDKYNGTEANIVSKKLFDKAQIKYRKYIKNDKKITLDL